MLKIHKIVNGLSGVPNAEQILIFQVPIRAGNLAFQEYNRTPN